MNRLAPFAKVSIVIIGVWGVTACWQDNAGPDGSCAIEPRSVLDCRVPGYTPDLQDVGLVSYSCSGSMRPDLDATFEDGVPEGVICADQGPLENSDDLGYCCTEERTTCAYDPSAECPDEQAGYECWGNNRPESLNPAIRCGNGNQRDGLVEYCCTGTPEPSSCRESSAAACGDRVKGFLCEGDQVPRGEDLGANQSRADYFYPTCSVAKPAPNPKYQTYCCFMPGVVPVAATCVNHLFVPGCEPGRYGFSCYGPDTPEDDYPTMNCPEPGFSGTSAEGYDATLYCCDFQ